MAAVGLRISLPRQDPIENPAFISPFRSGKRCVGVPDKARMALATAGAIGATPGSPIPVGLLSEGTIWVSTAGISFIRKIG